MVAFFGYILDSTYPGPDRNVIYQNLIIMILFELLTIFVEVGILYLLMKNRVKKQDLHLLVLWIVIVNLVTWLLGMTIQFTFFP